MGPGLAEYVVASRELLGSRSATSVCATMGLAGVGKTALAVHVAKMVMADGWFSGGVLFINLQSYDMARVVDTHIAAELALLYRSVLAIRAATDGPNLFRHLGVGTRRSATI